MNRVVIRSISKHELFRKVETNLYWIHFTCTNDPYLENLKLSFQNPNTPGPYFSKSLFWLPACPESVFLRSIKVFNFAAVFWFPHKSTVVSGHSDNLKISLKDFCFQCQLLVLCTYPFFSMEQQWKRGITLQHNTQISHNMENIFNQKLRTVQELFWIRGKCYNNVILSLVNKVTSAALHILRS